MLAAHDLSEGLEAIVKMRLEIWRVLDSQHLWVMSCSFQNLPWRLSHCVAEQGPKRSFGAGNGRCIASPSVSSDVNPTRCRQDLYLSTSSLHDTEIAALLAAWACKDWEFEPRIYKYCHRIGDHKGTCWISGKAVGTSEGMKQTDKDLEALRT